MRFSSITIILQSASIFFTTVAGVTTNQIDEPRKSFVCNGVTIKFNKFGHQRSLVEDAASKFQPGSLYQIYTYELTQARQNEHTYRTPFVYADNDTTNLSFYLLADLTSYENHRAYFITFDYYLVMDGRYRAHAILLKKTQENRPGYYEQMSDPSYELCKVGSFR
ncbi:BgTH12-06133 [Blumeria graminis f. sp. triticale]|uniref:BgTH12-06133 n=1 Tax=Blumeria graminis f. sp. triticale TaxID=1689686 RepID=A0A9W4D588_BLUGR|nr:BgTH12-06133 [Blumeria graminis f. sp. triticale]